MIKIHDQGQNVLPNSAVAVVDEERAQRKILRFASQSSLGLSKSYCFYIVQAP
jgi:hypothetical protein